MRTELRMHRYLVGGLATLLVTSVFVLLYLIMEIDAEDVEANLSVAVIFATGTIFACMGVAEALTATQFGPNHKRELLGYIIVGIGSLGCALYLGAALATSLDIVAILISFHTVSFGIVELRIAQHLQHHMKVRRLLRTGGVCQLVLGVALLLSRNVSLTYTVSILGCTAIFTSIQLLTFLLVTSMNDSIQLRLNKTH